MSVSTKQSNSEYQPVEILQKLIRFNTTNPPGNEAECIRYADALLKEAGFETLLVGKEPERLNLITRLKGDGSGAPLLLYGHVDVVTADNQKWTHPPFEGLIDDGCVWGRGALDMKGGVAMMLTAMLRAKAQGITPAGDVVLALVCDEEVGGENGVSFLVQNYAEHFQGIHHALGEFGGFPMYIGGKKFYAIQVAEKEVCWLKVTLRGRGGHGSMVMRGGVMAKLGTFLTALDTHRLPVHITPVVQQMLETIIAQTPPPTNLILSQLLDPQKTDATLDLMGPQGAMFDPVLHNTVNATIVQGGQKVNVIPNEITVALDGRLLPGYKPEHMIAELKGVVGDDVTVEVVQSTPGPAEPDMSLFELLGQVLKDADPEAIPLPFIVSGSTDARHFMRLNIQSYGFIPMNLPEQFNVMQLIHAADERVPVEAIEFGAQAISRVIQLYGKS